MRALPASIRIIALLAAAPLVLGAQTNAVCHPAANANESKLLVFYSGPIAFSPGAPTEALRAGAVRVSVEATYVPTPAASIRQPQDCYGQKKKENTELSPVFPRPRLTVGLPVGFAFEASYLPPITVADATPNLGSVALSRTSNVVALDGGRTLDLTVRAHGTMGLVRGSITCPAKALQQEAQRIACFGTTPSTDRFRPTTYGADGVLSMGGPTSAWRAYLGAGALRLEPTFQVGFQPLIGDFDDTRIAIHRTRATLFGGAGWSILPRAELSLELFSLPGSMTTARLGAGYRLR